MLRGIRSRGRRGPLRARPERGVGQAAGSGRRRRRRGRYGTDAASATGAGSRMSRRVRPRGRRRMKKRGCP